MKPTKTNLFALILLLITLAISLLSMKQPDKPDYTRQYIEMLEETIIDIAGEHYFLDAIEDTEEYQQYYTYCYDWKE